MTSSNIVINFILVSESSGLSEYFMALSNKLQGRSISLDFQRSLLVTNHVDALLTKDTPSKILGTFPSNFHLFINILIILIR